MSKLVRRNGLNAGMNKMKWWQRALQGLAVALGSSVGGPIGGIIAGAIFEHFMNSPNIGAEYNFNIQQERIIDAWNLKSFFPWFKRVLESVDGSITDISELSYQRRLTASNPVINTVNEARKDIAVMKAWADDSLNVTTSNFSGWSVEMLNARRDFIFYNVTRLEEAIEIYLESKGVFNEGFESRFNASSVQSSGAMRYIGWSNSSIMTSYRHIDSTSINTDLSTDPKELSNSGTVVDNESITVEIKDLSNGNTEVVLTNHNEGTSTVSTTDTNTGVVVSEITTETNTGAVIQEATEIATEIASNITTNKKIPLFVKAIGWGVFTYVVKKIIKK